MGGADTIQFSAYLSMMGLDACCTDGKTICADSLPAPGAGICTDASMFDGSVTLQQSGDVTCSQMALSTQTLIADGVSCEEQVDMGEGNLVSRATYLSMMGFEACCSDGKTACSDASAAAGAHICENADHFDGAVNLGGLMTCSAQAANFFMYFGADSSCETEVSMNDESVSKAAFLTTMTSCCSDSKTVCPPASGAKICANDDEFDGTVSLDEGAMKCSTVAMHAAGHFDASCEDQIDLDDTPMSKAEFFNMMNLASCCQDGQTVCSSSRDSPPGTDTSADSKKLSGSPSFLKTQTMIGTNESLDVDGNGAAMTTICFGVMVMLAGLVA